MYPSFLNQNFDSIKCLGIKIIIFIILFIGCVYQTYYICNFYYNYPTIVSTETEFDDNESELPAITFCSLFDRNRKGLTLIESLNYIDAKTLIKRAYIITFNFSHEYNVTEEVRKSIVISINTQLYCISINPQLKGEKNNQIYTLYSNKCE
jgi:hypothetical protein